MLDECIEYAKTQETISCSMIQRKFKLGYNRGGRIIDQMEDIGIIGPFEGSKERKVLVRNPDGGTTPRKNLDARIHSNSKKIAKLLLENIKLKQEAMLLSDDKQWYAEAMEPTIPEDARKKKIEKLIGRIHWNEDFKDDDTGETVSIERSEIVRVDGEWVV